MRHKIAITIPLLALFGLIFAFNTPLGAQISSNPRVIAFGDSLTFGVSTTRTYHSFLSEWAGVPIEMVAESGLNTSEALARVDSDVIARNPDIVIVWLGGADALQQVPEDTTFTNLQTIVERIQASGARVIILGLHRETIPLSSRESRYRQVAEETGAQYVPTPLSGILGRPQYFDNLPEDPVHPNEKAHEIIADRVWPQLQEALNEVSPDEPLRVHCRIDRSRSDLDNEDRVFLNQRVVWKAHPWGGPDTFYQFAWINSSINHTATSSADSLSFSPNDTGTTDVLVRVTSNGEIETAECPGIEVIERPLVGQCGVATNPTFGEVRWSASATGARGEFDYSWIGTDDLSSSQSSVTKVYTTEGRKVGQVTIHSGDQEIVLICYADLLIDEDNTSPSPLGSSCTISHSFGSDRVLWRSSSFGGTPPYTVSWSGENFSTTTGHTAEGRFTTPGVKNADVTVRDAEGEQISLGCAVNIATPNSNGDGGGCMIATAAFGTDMEPDVVTLRIFRDEKLLTNKIGQAFVRAYYKVSPPIADYIRDKDTLRAAVRFALKPVVKGAEILTD